MMDDPDEVRRRCIEALPYLIEFWQGYLHGESQEPTEAQIAAGFVELIDKEASFRMDVALGALEPYERFLYQYGQLEP